MHIDYADLKAKMKAAGYAVSEGLEFLSTDSAKYRDYAYFVLGEIPAVAMHELAFASKVKIGIEKALGFAPVAAVAVAVEPEPAPEQTPAEPEPEPAPEQAPAEQAPAEQAPAEQAPAEPAEPEQAPAQSPATGN